jgi:threonine dehydrogenase-like Zn-dependent dehydrogenase
MRAVRFNKPFDLEVTDWAEPQLVASTDAIIRVTATCVCGSDLWSFRGENTREHGTQIGHEFIGEVVEVGSDVRIVTPGDFVIVPFFLSCGVCPHCRNGALGACLNGGIVGSTVGGGQAEFSRVTFADNNLTVVPGGDPGADKTADLLALTDVMGTGYFCAVSANVTAGDTVAIIGDGAVGLSGVIAAKMLGAERVVAFSRNPERQALAREFGATHIIASRGEDATAEFMDLTDGIGADATLECVGLGPAMETAFEVARPGSTVGFVGVPHGVAAPIERMFRKNIGMAGGIAPTLTYTPLLLEAVLDGHIHPGRYFDLELPFERIVEGYAAMNDRTAIKAWARVS